MRLHILFGALAILAACSQEPQTSASIEEYWSLPLNDLPDGRRAMGVQYINAASIQEIDGARTVFQVAFAGGPSDPSRAGTRLDVVNDYDCANRRMRTVSTTIRIGASPPATSRGEGQEWETLDQNPNMQAAFDFVCGTPASRAADHRFTRITDTRPIQEIADDAIAAQAAEAP